MTGALITVRFRGHFRDLAGCDSLGVRFEPGEFGGEGPTLQQLLDRLDRQLPDGMMRETIRQAAIFSDGRLLGLDDRVKDGATVYILPPLAGGRA